MLRIRHCVPAKGHRNGRLRLLQTDTSWFAAGQGARGWQAGGLPDPGITSSGLKKSFYKITSDRLRHAGTRALGVSAALSAQLPVR